MKQYKVHIAYIRATGEIIRPGIYNEDEIDHAEALARSYVTDISTDSFVGAGLVKEKEDNPVKDVQLTSDAKVITDQAEIKEITLGKTVEVDVEGFKINTASITAIIELKYVGKKTADKVVNARKTQPFASYEDLDTRVPLPASRKWRDVIYMNFDYPRKAPTIKQEVFEVVDTGSAFDVK